MRRMIFLFFTLLVLTAGAVHAADPEEDSRRLDDLLKQARQALYNVSDQNLPEPGDVWTYKSGLVIGLFNIFDDQTENSLAAAQAGEDFYGIPNAWLAKDLDSAETAVLMQQVSVSSSSKSGKEYYIYARAAFSDPKTGEVPAAAATAPVYLTEAEKEAFNLYSVESCTGALEELSEKFSHPDGYKDRYDAAMALYNDQKYYSARQEFLASGYGDWEAMAEKCVRRRPSAGELWHDPDIWVKDMTLTFRIEQPKDTSIFIRLYKDGKPVSFLFVPGPGEVTAQLPGNGYYTIKDGIGTVWYGEKEAFGPEGSYETMTFDDAGTESVYLQSYYEYTISINIASGGTGVGSKDENWESFAEK